MISKKSINGFYRGISYDLFISTSPKIIAGKFDMRRYRKSDRSIFFHFHSWGDCLIDEFWAQRLMTMEFFDDYYKHKDEEFKKIAEGMIDHFIYNN